MSAVQISLNRERTLQVERIRSSRDDCKSLLFEDVVKKLFFEKVDEELVGI